MHWNYPALASMRIPRRAPRIRMNRLIIDCDPGIDDAVALLAACGSPEIELIAVTAVAGNRPLATTARNACRILDLAGRPDVPVYAGCARPIIEVEEARKPSVHGDDGLAGVRLASAREPVAEHASDFIARTLMSAEPNTVCLIAIGPLTNLALAEIKHPGVLARSRSLRVMGGAVFCAGNATPAAEFNFHADPIAAHVVLNAGAPLLLFGLDVTRKAVMPAAWVASLAQLEGVSGCAACTMLDAYAHAADAALHDACPLAHLLDPTLFAGTPAALVVDWAPGPSQGRVRARSPTDAAAPNAVAFTEVESERLLALLRGRIGRLP
jgi:purine nucleosidase